MIALQGIHKSFKVAKRSGGLGQAVKSFFVREHTIVEALHDISFTVNEGEIVGYIGPNGAGKSTTIKVMSGILVPDRGACSIMGFTPWKERKAYVQHIGVVFGQRSQLWWDVPVIDSYELLRDIYRIPPADYQSNLSLLTETLELGDLLQTPVRQLSLGQRMRCEIAASLLHGPKVLFLDEPTIGLDAVSKIAVRQFIKTINKEKGVTVILTTHDMSDIEALADRILMIGKGTLLYDGSLGELRRRFGTQRTITADFREHAAPVDIPGAARLSWSPERAVYSVDTEQVLIASVISSLAEQVDLVDVAVETKPVEELIVQLYKEHQI
ncbi:ATP-binding cassette domain-containing protein [Paenibacillus filicis]|uniref:ATP-binding cassette domain-containing protein n=1 Tax=Paenibacillus gyeongsangnamensis TaxID=3388067 RepID=A0ABT4Q5P4_9BACL|nr:ATP-binding cassette domain-containing protein [Paenibacillus filicis]MCZ8512195.1 ATP-binding cassette domain-containing protein [Paenibacillus filicis]